MSLTPLLGALACGDSSAGSDGTASTSAATTDPAGSSGGQTSASSTAASASTTSGSGTGATDSTSTSAGATTSTTDGIKYDVEFATTTDSGGGGEATCEEAAESRSSAGCLFAPIVGNQNWTKPWAVVAANTSPELATVELFAKDGLTLASAAIDPGQTHVFELLGDSPELAAHQQPAATMVALQAMRLESDVPIVAYQFTPFSSSQVATADASMLLPEHAWDTDYFAASYTNDATSWLLVVSLTDNNQVTITAPAGMQGATTGGGGIPALSAGQSAQVVVNAQQALRLIAPHMGPADLTGVRVESSAPVAVLTGAPSISLPGPGMNFYKDYVEEQLPPRSSWGETYAVVKFRPRSDEPDLYRFIADKDGTTITLSGGVEDSFTLDAGEFHQISTPASFWAESDDAFFVHHMMVSQDQSLGPKDDAMYPGEGQSGNCGAGVETTDLGDPAFSYVTPVDQFRSSYTFLSPTTYAWDMMTVTAPENLWGTIVLDGDPLPDPEATLGDSGFAYARFLIDDGPHEIHSPATTFGIDVYGYDCRISYAYPGGLNLEPINTPQG